MSRNMKETFLCAFLLTVNVNCRQKCIYEVGPFIVGNIKNIQNCLKISITIADLLMLDNIEPTLFLRVKVTMMNAVDKK